MKNSKLMVIILLLAFFTPIKVLAGSLNISSDGKVSNNKYVVNLTANQVDANYVSGTLNTTNAKITNIVMSNGWVNKTGDNSTFYFYHDGVSSGNYVIATFEVEMTNSSVYSLSNLSYGVYKCKSDSVGNLFGEAGKIVDSNTYSNTCLLSSDATLKSLTPSVGSFTNSFSKSNYYYNLNVSSNVTSVSFNAVVNDANAKVVSGEVCSLTSATTTCKIVVASQKGNTSTYTVTVYKAQDVSSSSSLITNFVVHNGVISETFNKDVYVYNLTPNANATDIYFTFNMNGESFTSNKCDANASSCKLTIKLNGKSYVYTFNINSDSSNVVSSTKTNKKTTISSNTSVKKSSSKKSSTTTSKATDTTKVEDVVTSNEEVSVDKIEESNTEEDETIDPLDYKESNKTVEVEEEETTSDSVISNDSVSTNYLFIILCMVNLVLGLLVGIFIKRKQTK
jgi:hypothetical protein